ncbi:MAG TPA: GGDEF domain-containing protein [Caldimonas sp.]|jgi:diguanylate cyclase (GGDEF)-like protein|nr:GGDEF domain-containing protein [Caldimonas sp.]HEX4234378.1 GGDEF domain-containing protein [Caldimonas sp.]
MDTVTERGGSGSLPPGTRVGRTPATSKPADVDDLDATPTLRPRPLLARREGVRFPSLTPRLGERVSALRARFGVLMWLYALVPLPLVTDWIENGEPPNSPRGWVTEILGGLVILLLVARVRRDHRALEVMSRSDALTGLLNRRAFAAAIEVECARARRSREPLCVAYLDIDNFKAINDRFGHAAGDQVLRQFAMAVGQTVRVHLDGAFRLGGDEFTLLLAATSAEQAEVVVDRIRSFCAVHDSRWAVGAFEFSAGIVVFDPAESTQELMTRGDALMYRQKQMHRSSTR